MILKYTFTVHYNPAYCRDLWSWKGEFINGNGCHPIEGGYWHDTLDQAAAELQSEYLRLCKLNDYANIKLLAHHNILRI